MNPAPNARQASISRSPRRRLRTTASAPARLPSAAATANPTGLMGAAARSRAVARASWRPDPPAPARAASASVSPMPLPLYPSASRSRPVTASSPRVSGSPRSRTARTVSSHAASRAVTEPMQREQVVHRGAGRGHPAPHAGHAAAPPARAEQRPSPRLGRSRRWRRGAGGAAPAGCVGQGDREQDGVARRRATLPRRGSHRHPVAAVPAATRPPRRTRARAAAASPDPWPFEGP